ncbi:hypothetical protein HGRIS_000651 [Hohenbuehelia grisea]|uniref:Uncharacterized protein n=1 Tax=Hohenbuehelia grisea TaxID=104357 RepID=A0ABR3JS98_9AGAR
MMYMDCLTPPPAPPPAQPSEASTASTQYAKILSMEKVQLPSLCEDCDKDRIVQFTEWIAALVYSLLFVRPAKSVSIRCKLRAEMLRDAAMLMAETMVAMRTHSSSVLQGLFYITRLNPEPTFDAEAEHSHQAVVSLLLRFFMLGTMLANKYLRDGKHKLTLWFEISDMVLECDSGPPDDSALEGDRGKEDRYRKFLEVERAALAALNYKTLLPHLRWQSWLTQLITHPSLAPFSKFHHGPVLSVLRCTLRISRETFQVPSGAVLEPLDDLSPELVQEFRDKMIGDLELHRCSAPLPSPTIEKGPNQCL